MDLHHLSLLQLPQMFERSLPRSPAFALKAWDRMSRLLFVEHCVEHKGLLRQASLTTGQAPFQGIQREGYRSRWWWLNRPSFTRAGYYTSQGVNATADTTSVFYVLAICEEANE